MAGKAVKSHLDRDNIFISCSLTEHIKERCYTLIRIVQQHVFFQHLRDNRRVGEGWRFLRSAGLIAKLGVVGKLLANSLYEVERERRVAGENALFLEV